MDFLRQIFPVTYRFPFHKRKHSLFIRGLGRLGEGGGVGYISARRDNVATQRKKEGRGGRGGGTKSGRETLMYHRCRMKRIALLLSRLWICIYIYVYTYRCIYIYRTTKRPYRRFVTWNDATPIRIAACLSPKPSKSVNESVDPAWIFRGIRLDSAPL